MTRLVRVPLDGQLRATDGALLVRDDERPFALVGAWAGGGALVGSEPVSIAADEADPFAVLDDLPRVADASGAVGGGWFGYLGYGLGARVETLPPGPPRPGPLPRFALAFYDHLLRRDADGQWWFEALWSDWREEALRARLAELSARLAAGARDRPARAGAFAPRAPGAAGHVAAVAECRERIAAGEIFQANLCLRLDGTWSGSAADLFVRCARALEPRYAAFVAGPWGALGSMSPELFLRRRGRRVVSAPIKGTRPRVEGARDALAASPKDRAENVMIVDLMRNDLGRVCEYGSVAVDELAEPRPAPGVWHLVSTVSGTLRPGLGNSDLLRASFPPGSVTGAPKIQTMRVIAELEATGREVYTGAIGYASPLAGLELNVAIRTLELSGERAWLGAGGGIVADSDPETELEECMVKARPVIEATGGRLLADAPRRRAVLPAAALDGEASRPDPALGVFSTLLVREGAAVDPAAHVERVRASVAELYGASLDPEELAERVRAAAAGHDRARLRVLAAPDGSVDVELERLAAVGHTQPVMLAPTALPGGLGAHKWRDRRLLATLERRLGAVPLLVDLDGQVLESAHANVWIAEGDVLVTPPLDGRLLPGTARAALLADAPPGLEPREEPITLDRLAAADELLLTSSLRGVHPATLAGAPVREPLHS